MGRRTLRRPGFPELLVSCRERLRATRAGIAERCGVSESAVGRWERGRLPSPRSVPALEDALRMSRAERDALESLLRDAGLDLKPGIG